MNSFLCWTNRAKISGQVSGSFREALRPQYYCRTPVATPCLFAALTESCFNKMVKKKYSKKSN